MRVKDIMHDYYHERINDAECMHRLVHAYYAGEVDAMTKMLVVLEVIAESGPSADPLMLMPVQGHC